MNPEPTTPPTPETPPALPPDRWAVVELMGHRRYIGRLSEGELFGTRVGLIEHFNHDGTTQVVQFRPDNVYAVTSTTEAAVRAEVARNARCYLPLPAYEADAVRAVIDSTHDSDSDLDDSDLDRDMADARGERVDDSDLI